MKYTVTFCTDMGVVFEDTLSLPVSDSITWEDFVNLREIKNLALEYPHAQLVDVTPHGMPDRFTAEEELTNMLREQGLKKGQKSNGMTEYTELEDEGDA